MEYLKLYENFESDENDDLFYELKNKIEPYLHNVDEIDDVISYYLNTLNNLLHDGGLVYRLVFLNEVSDLKQDNLGESWTIDKSHLNDFAHRLQDNLEENSQNKKPYLITATLNPEEIDYVSSLEVFGGEYYYEYEVILKLNPKNIIVEPFE